MMNGPVKWHFFRKNLVKLVLQYIRKWSHPVFYLLMWL